MKKYDVVTSIYIPALLEVTVDDDGNIVSVIGSKPTPMHSNTTVSPADGTPEFAQYVALAAIDAILKQMRERINKPAGEAALPPAKELLS